MAHCTEPYAQIADLYDVEHDQFDDDFHFYRQMLDAGPVLEVGVGTGRLAVPLARAGLEVWGVDPSDAMIERARSRAGSFPSLHLIECDIRRLQVEQRFQAAMFTLNTLWHLPDSDGQLSALRAVAAHLVPAGLLLVDTSNPHTMDDRGAAGAVRVRFRTSRDGADITGFSAAWDDEAAQRLTLDLWYDLAAPDGRIQRRGTQLRLRYLYRFELEMLLRLAGFRIEHVYGSYDLEAYETVSPRLILSARLVDKG
jgi:SAM-dependent methyltransferase